MSQNEYIKVDDLFKGRPDREERIPPGSWSNMQHLLETAGTTGGGSIGFNRYVALALLTLGLGTAAVSWQYNLPTATLDQQTYTQAGTKDGAAMPESATSGTMHHRATPNQEASSDATAMANDPNGSAAHARHTAMALSAAGNNHMPDGTGKAPHQAASAEASPSHHTPAQHTATAAVRGNSQHSSAPQATGAGKATTGIAQHQSTTETGNQPTTEMIAQQLSQSQTTARTKGQAINIDLAADQALASIDKTPYLPKVPADSAYLAVIKGTEEKFVMSEKDQKWYKEKSTIVNEIHTTRKLIKDNQTQQVSSVIIDTTKQERYTRTRLEPLNTQDKLQLLAIASNHVGLYLKAEPFAFAEPVSASTAATHASAEAAVNLKPLSEYKVSSRKSTEQKASFMQRFYDVLNNYFNMEKPYYFGAAIGMNSTVSSYMPSGYHFSLGGYYELKERLTLGAELKYTHASLLPQNILETFKTYDNPGTQVIDGKTMYTATEYTKQNSYQLEALSSFELPVTLRYQLSKFSIFGGVQARYLLPVSYTSLLNQDKENAKSVLSETALVSQQPKISDQDFRSRLGLGYSMGIIYDLSKNISLDIRVSQTLWDNVRNTSQLSSQLYQYPNIQFSLFYYLGKKDKVIYMMSDRK